jgi:hypothetical protein
MQQDGQAFEFDSGYTSRLGGATEEQGVMEWRRGFHAAQWDLDHQPDGSLVEAASRESGAG